MKKSIRYVIYVAVPPLTAYLASNDSIIQFFINKGLLKPTFNLQGFHEFFKIINILFTTIFLGIKACRHEEKEESYKKQVIGLYNMTKQFLQSNLINISNNDALNFDLRIFVPEYNVLKMILHAGQLKEKWFVIRNIEPFASRDTTEHLRFRVMPDPQGLVGIAYKTKSIVYDDNLRETNSKNYYLNQSQINRTSNLNWSICIPILDDKNDVIAVMAIDSDTTEFKMKRDEVQIQTLTNTFAVMMRDSAPELFKKEVKYHW